MKLSSTSWGVKPVNHPATDSHTRHEQLLGSAELNAAPQAIVVLHAAGSMVTRQTHCEGTADHDKEQTGRRVFYNCMPVVCKKSLPATSLQAA